MFKLNFARRLVKTVSLFKQVLLNVPTKEQRVSILEVLTASIQLDVNVSLVELATWTTGYVGSDLKALCEEAISHATTKVIPPNTLLLWLFKG